MQHRLSDLNTDELKAVCKICGPVGIVPRTRSNGYFGWRCKKNKRNQDTKRKYPNRFKKKDCCERCGFIPEIPSQLDVDHIDGNRKNNDLSNLQTLCANCHRLKTYHNKDWLNKY